MKLGELLIKAKVINEAQLKVALQEQGKWGGKLGEILVRMNVLTEETLVKALSKLLNVPRVDLDKEPRPDPAICRRLPHHVASDLSCLPLRLEDDGKYLVVAMADPTNLPQLDSIRAVSRCKVRPMIAGASQIARALARAYEGEADVGSGDEPFKVVDAQGRTVVKAVPELSSTPATSPPIATGAEPSTGSTNPALLLQAIEETQRKEVASLRAMIDLLIEKGVFSRDEYIARVRK